MKENLMKAIDELIGESNKQNDIAENKDSAPMKAGRAAWKRQGIMYAIKTIVEQTGVCNFDELFENK